MAYQEYKKSQNSPNTYISTNVLYSIKPILYVVPILVDISRTCSEWKRNSFSLKPCNHVDCLLIKIPKIYFVKKWNTCTLVAHNNPIDLHLKIVRAHALNKKYLRNTFKNKMCWFSNILWNK